MSVVSAQSASFAIADAQAPSAAGGTSAVPERFRATSRPVPGESVVPPEYQGSSAPSVASSATSKGPAEDEADRDSGD